MTQLSTCGQQLDPQKARSGDPARQFCSPLFDVHQWAPYQIMAVHDVPYFPLYNVVRPFPVQLRLCLTTAAHDQCAVCRHICWGPHGPTDSAKYMSRHPRTARNGWRHPSFAVQKRLTKEHLFWPAFHCRIPAHDCLSSGILSAPSASPAPR